MGRLGQLSVALHQVNSRNSRTRLTRAASDNAPTHSTHVITRARRRRSAGTMARATPAAARSAAEPTATWKTGMFGMAMT